MLIYYSKEDLIKFLKAELKAWEKVGGGPNLLPVGIQEQ